MPRTEHPVREDAGIPYQCSRCKNWKPRTLKFWPKDSWMRDGMSVRCKACASEATLRSRAKKLGREYVPQERGPDVVYPEGPGVWHAAGIPGCVHENDEVHDGACDCPEGNAAIEESDAL